MRFKDVFSIIGPAMVGPSSSHTAGAVRIGRVARQLLGVRPERAKITFYGSFAETYQGHGTDLAIVAGLLGHDTDDPGIPVSLELAAESGMAVQFATALNPVFHPNTAKLVLQAGDRATEVLGNSIGGGNIEIVSVDDFDVKFTGASPTLVISHADRPGMVAEVTALLRERQINIAAMDVDRKGRNGEAMTVLEIDSPATEELESAVSAVAGVQRVRVVDLARKPE
jgi:L-serine dehydratase